MLGFPVVFGTLEVCAYIQMFSCQTVWHNESITCWLMCSSCCESMVVGDRSSLDHVPIACKDAVAILFMFDLTSRCTLNRSVHNFWAKMYRFIMSMVKYTNEIWCFFVNFQCRWMVQWSKKMESGTKNYCKFGNQLLVNPIINSLAFSVVNDDKSLMWIWCLAQ